MAANVKVDVRKNNSVEGLYKVNFINVDEGEDKIVASIDCGIETLYLIRDVIGNAIDTIEKSTPVTNN